jgi:hypothetical protein
LMLWSSWDLRKSLGKKTVCKKPRRIFFFFYFFQFARTTRLIIGNTITERVLGIVVRHKDAAAVDAVVELGP